MAEELTTSTVSFASNGQNVDAYLAHPSSGGPHPGLIVIQEWWGVDEHIKDVTERFAREGYVSVAVDLYCHFDTRITEDADEAADLAGRLAYDSAMRDLAAGVEYLKNSDKVGNKPIGVVGYCLGGGYSLLMACKNRDIAAAVAYYGQIVNDQLTDENPVNPIDEVPQMICPLFFVHAGADEYITLDHANRLRDAMQAAGKEGEVRSYQGAPHAFFNDAHPEVYRAEEAQDTWKRTLAFFQRHLGG